jgi:1-acyl-sn-glycerol-3-phosphate acyltransferase
MFIFDQIKAFVVALSLALSLVPVCVMAVPFRLKKRLEIVIPFWRFAAKFAMRHACEAIIDVAEDRRTSAFKATGDTGIFIANHQSYIDIPLIVTMYQVPPIMKKEVLYIPFVGQLGWICGAMPVSRSNMGSKRKVFDQTKKRILQDKIGIQVYPEGTRSKNAEPQPFEKIKKALLVLAYNEKIPVTPTSIYGTRGVLSEYGFFNTKRHVGIIVHEELRPENYKDSDEFARACWKKVVEGFTELSQKIAHQNKS